jgi:hypothetical protein
MQDESNPSIAVCANLSSDTGQRFLFWGYPGMTTRDRAVFAKAPVA